MMALSSHISEKIQSHKHLPSACLEHACQRGIGPGLLRDKGVDTLRVEEWGYNLQFNFPQ